MVMTENDKREFFAILTSLAEMPLMKAPQSVTRTMVSMYFSALSHRSIEDVKTAINLHIRDSERGRYYPSPADIEHQLPAEKNAWLDAEEAWAMCPKDEYVSAPMNDVIGGALLVAQDLIYSGDMVAARMAFKSAYNRLVEEAKAEGKNPKWFPSYGYDKQGRYEAEVKTVELTNRLLHPEKHLPLPKPPITDGIGVEQLMISAQESKCDYEKGMQYLANLKKMFGGESER
jgi:hypothetical protein